MKKYAVIVAAGIGSRMGNPLPKQFLLLAGKSLLQHSVEAFMNAYPELEIILVVPETHLSTAKTVVNQCPGQTPVTIVPGAPNRFGSVKLGLERTSDDSVIFIHDGVRCLLTKDLIHRCYEETILYGNAIPAIKPVDSVRILQDGAHRSIDRDQVKLIQTPQTFSGKLIRQAYNEAKGDHFTDEASVAENHGIKIHLMEGELSNIKITHPADMLLADMILRERDLTSSGD